MRIVFILALAGLALFCGYGFLAAAEPGEGHEIWRMGYAVGGTVSLLGALAFALRRPRS